MRNVRYMNLTQLSSEVKLDASVIGGNTVYLKGNGNTVLVRVICHFIM